MGSGFKDFTAGDVLTAAQVDGYLMRQSTMVFASTTARDTALSGNLEDGMVAYCTDVDTLYSYDGSSWGIIVEPPQTWTPTVTQSSSVSGTYTRGWYRRSFGLFTAVVSWSSTGTGTASNPITISTPVTLASQHDVGGSFSYNDGGTFYTGVVLQDTTTTVKMLRDGATGSLGASSPTIASGDVIRLHLEGRY